MKNFQSDHGEMVIHAKVRATGKEKNPQAEIYEIADTILGSIFIPILLDHGATFFQFSLSLHSLPGNFFLVDNFGIVGITNLEDDIKIFMEG